MTAEDLKAAGFSNAEVSQYEQLQGAGFSQEEIIKHFDKTNTSPSAEMPVAGERKSWGSLPIDIVKNLKNAVTDIPADALRMAEVAGGGIVKGATNILQGDLLHLSVPGWDIGKTIEDRTGIPVRPYQKETERILDAIRQKLVPTPVTGSEKIVQKAAEIYPVMAGFSGPMAAIRPTVGATAGSVGLTEAFPGNEAVTDLIGQVLGGTAMEVPAMYQKGKAAFNAARKGAPAVTEKRIAERADKVVTESLGDSPYYQPNAAEAAKLEETIPNLKFTLGERTGSPGAIKLQRSLEAGQGPAAQRMAESRDMKNQAVRDYLQNEFKGDETIDDVIDALRAKQANLEGTAKWDEGFTGQTREAIPSAGTMQEAGRKIVEAEEAVRVPDKAVHSEMYKNLGNPATQTKETRSAVKSLEEEFTPGETGMFPTEHLKRVKAVLEPPKGAGKTVNIGGTEFPEKYNGFKLDGEMYGAAQYSEIKSAEAGQAKATFYVKPGEDLATRYKETLRKFPELSKKYPAPEGNISTADAEKAAKRGLETVFSRYKKNKIQLTDDIAAEIKASGKKNLYTLFRKDGGGTSWDKVAQELADEGEFPGFAAGDKMDATRFVEWLSENPVLGDKGAYTERYAATLGKSRAAAADTGERGFQDMHSLRKDLGREINKIGSNPNMDPLRRRLEILRNAVEADIEASLGNNSDYAMARRAAAEHFNKFKSKNIWKARRPGNLPDKRDLPYEEVPKLFFTETGADELINAIGPERSAALMRPTAVTMMENSGVVNPVTREIVPGKLSAWVFKNRPVLEKYGILKDFQSLEGAYQLMGESSEKLAQFNKSIAAKMLNADPRNAIGHALTGGEGISAKNTRASMEKLIDGLRPAPNEPPDPKALAGLRKGFQEFLLQESGVKGGTLAPEEAVSAVKFADMMDKYDGALRALYNDKPQQLQALQNVRRALRIAARSITSPVGGGSDTAEKMINHTFWANLFGHVPGLNYLGRLARSAIRMTEKEEARNVNELVVKMLYDGDFAQIMDNARKGIAPKVAERAVKSELSRIAATAAVIGEREKAKEEEIQPEVVTP